MLKFETTANVGDIIKAFDFEPMADRPDSFVVGTVVSKNGIADVGYHAYKIEVLKHSREYEDMVGETVYVPFEVFGGSEHDNRVTKVV